MPKYVKVHIDGPHRSETLYVPLNEDTDPTDATVHGIGQELVNERYSWGAVVVDETDVPADDRI